jgi:hypothetical protein
MSQNATELAATVISSGSSQAVTGTGVQSVSFSGLTASTSYYAHYVHTDAADNDSARVSSAQFTTDAASGGGGVVYRAVTITPAPETIVSISGSTAGSTITVTTGGLRDLTVNAPTLTYGGLACTSITVTSAITFTCVMPVDGFALGSTNNFVATILGVETAPLAAVFDVPSGKQFATFSVPFASFVPDSLWRDAELSGVANAIAIGDQVVAALKSSATTLQPAGWDVVIDGLGNVSLAGSGIGSETEVPTVALQLIDASDSYSISNTMLAAISINAPAGTLTLGTPAATSTTITLPFTWDGVVASSFNYRVNGGSWVEILSTPIVLIGLTQDVQYTIDVRPMNGAFYGDTKTVSVTTTATLDLTPDAFAFTPQEGVQINSVVTFNAMIVTGVATGQDVPVSIFNGEYSVSTDGGQNWGPWTNDAGTVRLNHRIRPRHTSSGYYQSLVDTILLVGGTAGTATSTTRADDVGPVVTLAGSATVAIVQGATWVDPGATALDNVDGAVTVTTSGTVNTSIVGSYTLTYTAYDQEGNAGSAVRIVNVVAAPDTSAFPYRRTVTWEGGGTAELGIGDTFRHRCTLNSDGEAWNASAATDITVCIISLDRTTRYTDDVSVTLDAGWESGVITVVMPIAITAEIAEHVTGEQFAWAEIQATIAGGEKYTWSGSVRAVQRHIA